MVRGTPQEFVRRARNSSGTDARLQSRLFALEDRELRPSLGPNGVIKSVSDNFPVLHADRV